MKLLLDQNLSHRMVKPLADAFPDTSQVSFLKLGDASDREIWDYAKQNGYAIVTLDADFHEFSLMWGGPPLVVWLKCGNQPKNVVVERLLRSKSIIEDAGADEDIWCIEIY